MNHARVQGFKDVIQSWLDAGISGEYLARTVAPFVGDTEITPGELDQLITEDLNGQQSAALISAINN